MRRVFFSSLLGLLLVAGANRPSANRALAAQAGPAAEIIQLVNQVRASYGLPPLQVNNALVTAAQNHANWMAANNIYSHTGEGGSSPQSRATAVGYGGYATENIVGGTNLTPRQGIIWWQNSAVHFNSMISTRYTQVGAGYASGNGQNFYTLVVGRPADAGPVASGRGADTAGEPIIVIPIKLAQPREDGSIVHVVGEGQSAWMIAAHYEITLADFLLFNGLTEDDVLQPGDEVTVRLADGQPPPPTPTPPMSHIVREGQTAWTIAAQYRISLDDLFLFNNLTEDDILHPGDEIIIRWPADQPLPPTPTPPITHIVQSGETAWTIAAIHGLTIDQLLAFNGLGPDPILHPGDELLIQSPTPAATATEIAPAEPPTPAPALAMAAVTELASPSPTPTARPLPTPVLSPTPAATASDRGFGQAVAFGTMIAGIGLTILAGVAFMAIRRQ
ncbi:MAG TPA: LysM peptidoglycan-binding domain-containing protein [Anaerolineae bacterium]